jgi:hypothetical protein
MWSGRGKVDQAPGRQLDRGSGSVEPHTHDMRWGAVGAALDAEVPDRDRLRLRSARGVVIAILLSGVCWVFATMWLW